MKNVIQNLNQTIEKYYPILKEMDDVQFSIQPNPEKWSKKEELGHLTDSAQNNIQRFIRVQYEEHVHVMYDPDNWVEFNNYQNKEKNDVIELWYHLNKQIIAVLEKMPAGKYEQLMCFVKDASVKNTALFIAEDYVKHLKHHLDNIVQ